MLPYIASRVARHKSHGAQFLGLDHNLVVQPGAFWDMKNLTGDFYPVLSPRRGRKLVRTIQKPNGLFVKEKLCWVDGTTFYYDGAAKGTVEDSEKRFARLGAYVLIWPDKVCYNTVTDEFKPLASIWAGSATIGKHTYDAEGEAAQAVYQGNAIRTTGTPFPFEVGEAVFLSGSSTENNNRSAVIREVLEDGKLLVFSNNTFTEHGAQTLTLERKIPDLEYFCEVDNRLWGCTGNEIFASALGNPFRWNNYEGLATDSYAVSVGSDGPFTGAASYLGYPIFFKEDAIHKMYGTQPSNFQSMESAELGVMAGSAGSIANAGETLFYLSRTGIVSYAGGIPTPISGAFGAWQFDQAVGGSDGRRYYVSMRQGEHWTLFVYDTQTGLWHKEDDTHALAFARVGGRLYLLDGRDNGLYEVNAGGFEGVSWMAETGDFVDNGSDKTGLTRLQMRLEADSGSEVLVEIQFDSDGVWRPVRRIGRGEKRSVVLPIIPRRCDHYRLRLSGRGGCRVYSITREAYKGSEVR